MATFVCGECREEFTEPFDECPACGAEGSCEETEAEVAVDESQPVHA